MSFKSRYKAAHQRWKAKTPLLFKNIIKIGLGISGVAVAIHMALETAGAVEPEWWTMIYPYLVGFPAGMAAVAKFTQSYDKDGHPIYDKDTA